MDLGNIIAQYRKSQNITQEALAQLLGVTNQAVSKWESGQCCPDVMLLPKLADIFGIPIDALFGRTPPAVPQISGLPWSDDNTLRAVLYRGHTLLKADPHARNITFTLEGDALSIDSAFSVSCGDVRGGIQAGTCVSCGNVVGNIEAGSHVSCGNVEGDIDAGSNVNCGNVVGNIDAGSGVKCGIVSGNVDAGGFVTVRK